MMAAPKYLPMTRLPSAFNALPRAISSQLGGHSGRLFSDLILGNRPFFGRRM